MSKSNIVFKLEYQNPKNKTKGISGWIKYATQKNKADPSSIDQYNLLNDFIIYSKKDAFITESDEAFLWNSNGDVAVKDVLDKIKVLDNNGMYWRGFLSFPSEFALNHGLITKIDYYSLTNNVMPSLILDMGLDLNNTEWMCALHLDTPKHPHIHLCIYEKVPMKTNPRYPKSVIYKFKSNVVSYLIDNIQFYELRDKTFAYITEKINLKEFNKIKSQRLFSDSYRKELNKKLLSLYEHLPKKGRLQYNSKNMIPYKEELNSIIEYILLHDSVKYDYAKYLRLLDEHQKELNNLYGNSQYNKKRKYYNDQLNRLYSKIGNEILANFKRYQSTESMEREKQFLQKHILELNFKSRNDYSKEETKKNIAKDLYKLCMISGLNDTQIKKIFYRWIQNSHYDFDVETLISSVATSNIDMSTTEFYNSLKKLGYDFERYNKFKNKYFYRELNYKSFINQAINHLMYELEQEEKQIIEEIQYNLEVEDYKV
ncbi:MAG: hypothetical protein IJ068_00415 [Bacilli bacterium]|nr:hypothetical protein [Bacilli bacterium]